MDERQLAYNRLKYLFPLRNKHAEYRRSVRLLLRRLRSRMGRSDRIRYEGSRAATRWLMTACSLYAMDSAKLKGHL